MYTKLKLERKMYMNEEILKTIYECGIIPVIKIDEAKDAVPLCKSLYDGGIFVAEITFRTEAAEQSIRNVTENLPDVLVGAGTVSTVDIAKKAIAAGAKFIVTPGFNVKVVEYCLQNNIVIIPGVSSPTDIELGLSYGLTTLKFFPAETSGGLKALKAMSAPYGMVKFMPTGGIDRSNIADYLKFDKIIACGGSFMVKDELIKQGNFEEITKLSKEAVSSVHGFEFLHLGVHNDEMQTPSELADKFSNVFGFKKLETPVSFYSSDFIEIMKTKGKGEHGHIGIKTLNVLRAISYFERNGLEVDRSTIKGTEENPTFIYLKDKFGPFAVHVTKDVTGE
jgi:2-dehydro-3-deoxyphosphogluconate aldolase / (4S)-4-hydroxy-2-oxoglutarate aldolase